jgi:hypothetical protein
MPPIRDDDPPELRQRLFGSPALVAENAMRLAWEARQDVNLLSGEVKNTSARLLDLEGRIISSLGRIEQRLGIVERKPIKSESRPEHAAVVITSSQRPISYHELPDAIAKVMPEIERRQAVAWWMGVIDGFKNAFREGLRKGAAGAVAALVLAGLLLAAGYFLRDCAHSIVKTGNSSAVPKIHGVE